MYNFIDSRNAPHIQGPSWVIAILGTGPDEARNIVTIMRMVIVIFL